MREEQEVRIKQGRLGKRYKAVLMNMKWRKPRKARER